MKTLEELADSYIKENSATINKIESNIVKCDFKAGFKEAQRWIELNEEYPPYYIDILVKLKDGSVEIAHYNTEGYFIRKYSKIALNVISWRLIEYK